MNKKLEAWFEEIQGSDEEGRERVRLKLENLAMPRWGLGRLMDLAVHLGGMGISSPLKDPLCVVMAGDHGVVDEGVTAFPSAITSMMLRTMTMGKASINAMAKASGARVLLVDVGSVGDHEDLFREGLVLDRRVGPGTQNLAKNPAMSEEETLVAMEVGVALAKSESFDVAGLGEMGIGNTTPATAITCALTGCSPSEIVGPGAGLDDEGMFKKGEVIQNSLDLHKARDPFDILRCLGGFEIAAMTGFVLGASSLRRPVLMDGLISSVACAIAVSLEPKVKDFLIPSHGGSEPAHQALLSYMDMTPLIDFAMHLGEGTGAALALPMVITASGLTDSIATLDEVLGN